MLLLVADALEHASKVVHQVGSLSDVELNAEATHG